jgi:hypothetical protein
MYRTVANIFLIMIWLSQFYSVVGLVFWINRKAADPGRSPRKINAAITVQIIILAAIGLFFAFDYLRNHSAGSGVDAPSLRFYVLNGLPYLIIPGIFLLFLLKIKRRSQR